MELHRFGSLSRSFRELFWAQKVGRGSNRRLENRCFFICGICLGTLKVRAVRKTSEMTRILLKKVANSLALNLETKKINFLEGKNSKNAPQTRFSKSGIVTDRIPLTGAQNDSLGRTQPAGFSGGFSRNLMKLQFP